MLPGATTAAPEPLAFEVEEVRRLSLETSQLDSSSTSCKARDKAGGDDDCPFSGGCGSRLEQFTGETLGGRKDPSRCLPLLGQAGRKSFSRLGCGDNG